MVHKGHFDYSTYSSAEVRQRPHSESLETFPIQTDVLQLISKYGLCSERSYTDGAMIREVLQSALKISGEIVPLKTSLSGNIAFKILIEDVPAYFAKIGEDANKLVATSQKFTSLNLVNSSIPPIVHSDLSCIIHPFLNGKDFGKYLIERAPIEIIRKQAQILGKALAELHSHTFRSCDSTSFAESIRKKGSDFLLKLAGKIQEPQLIKLQKMFHSSVNVYLTEQDWQGFVHGDANPGNFFCDEARSHVTFVNIGNFSLGYPSYEKNQMVSSFKYYHIQYGAPLSLVNAAIEEFLRGYNETVTLSATAEKLYSLYWTIRTLVTSLENQRSEYFESVLSFL